MPMLAADDGVKLYYEEAGSGTPIVFVHEFAGDHRSWEAQLQHFSRRYRCIDLVEEMRRIDVPALIVAGDEDEGSLEASLLMKRTIRSAALAVLPKSGHLLNLEEPARFNALVEDFFHQVESGRWTPRDARSTVASVYGPGGKP